MKKNALSKATLLVPITLIVLAGALSLVSLVQAQTARDPIAGQLGLGSQGGDVTKLQTLLASNRDIYPEGLVTGYFGPMTAKAVAQFQLAYGLPSVGRVGPMTLAKINGLITSGVTSLDIYAPSINNVQVQVTANTATITWITNEQARGKVYYDVNTVVTLEPTTPMTEPVSSGLFAQESFFATNHSVTLSNLEKNRAYSYVIQSTDLYGNVSVTLPIVFTTAQ